MTETNIYASTVPGMYGKKNKVEVRNKILLGSFGTLSCCYYLFIYAYDVKTSSISLYHFLIAKSIRILYFPIYVIKKIGFPIFHSEWFCSCLVPAMDCFKGMYKDRILIDFKTFFDDMMMVVNAFLYVFLNTIWRFSWSCLENQVSGAWISMSAYGTGRALLEKRRRSASR